MDRDNLYDLFLIPVYPVYPCKFVFQLIEIRSNDLIRVHPR